MMNHVFRLAILVLLSSVCGPSYSQSDKTPTAGEQRLMDDQRILPVPDDARFNELLMRDYAMMMMSGGPTDDPQSVFPNLRILIFAIPRPCAGLENFYQRHWPGFKFLVDSSSGSAEYRAFLGWQNDDLVHVQVDSFEDLDESAEGVLLMVSEHSPDTENSMREMAREMYGIPDDTEWCSAFVLNARKVTLSDIPLSERGLSSGDVYSSVSDLFNVIVPSADNFFVDRYSIAETSTQDSQQFVEEVSFLIGDFGELYRVGVVRLNQEFAPAADALAQVPLARHFQEDLPGDVESVSTEMVIIELGQAVQALYRVEGGSMLMQITGLDPLETSTQSDALVAVMAVRIGDYLIFASAQNDYLASEDEESVLIASIKSKTVNLMKLLTWSRDLPGDTEVPIIVMSPQKHPHLERCARQFETDDGVAFENTCDQPIALQIFVNLDWDNVVEDIIPQGETFHFVDEERRFAFAVCPSGYEADRTFDGENLSSILASQYNCSQSDVGSPSITR